jgi:hypothetical protein
MATLGRTQMTYTLDEESKADLKSISQVSVSYWVQKKRDCHD